MRADHGVFSETMMLGVQGKESEAQTDRSLGRRYSLPPILLRGHANCAEGDQLREEDETIEDLIEVTEN